jgi:hypothetical protein
MIISENMYFHLKKPSIRYLQYIQVNINNLSAVRYNSDLNIFTKKKLGWIVRIYHNLKKDDSQSWESFNSHLEIGSHVDICNATEVVENRKLGTHLGAATWRWVGYIKTFNFNCIIFLYISAFTYYFTRIVTYARWNGGHGNV